MSGFQRRSKFSDVRTLGEVRVTLGLVTTNKV